MRKKSALITVASVLTLTATAGVLRPSTQDAPSLEVLAEARVKIARRSFEEAERALREPIELTNAAAASTLSLD